VVTVTLTVPVPTGDVAVIEVALLTVKDAALPAPKSTVLAPVKLAPVIATREPLGPESGVTPVTTGTEEAT
jgi:hypothetical protein